MAPPLFELLFWSGTDRAVCVPTGLALFSFFFSRSATVRVAAFALPEILDFNAFHSSRIISAPLSRAACTAVHSSACNPRWSMHYDNGGAATAP